MRTPRTRTKLASGLILVAWLATFLPVAPVGAAPPLSALTIASHGEQGLDLALTAPPVEIGQVENEDRAYVTVSMPGWVTAGGPGEPELPLITARIVVPPDVSVTLEALEQETETVRLAAPPLPAPRMSANLEPDGAVTPVDYRYEEGPAYHSESTFPAELCAITADDVVRDWRLVQVTCNPARYRPADTSLIVTRSARLHLSFPNPSAGQPPLSAQTLDPLQGALAGGLLNPDDMPRYRLSAPSLAAAALAEPVGQYRLMVDEAGIFAVSYDDLLAAGLDLAGVRSDTLRLIEGTQEVALLVQDGDGTFGPGDRFLFFGRERESVYGTTNSYLLDWGGATGLRVQSRAAGDPTGTTTHLLADALLQNYDPRWPDPWRSDWTDVYVYDPAYSDVAEDGHFYAGSVATLPPADMPDREWFAASAPGVVGGQGTLSVTLRGTTDTPHLLGFDFGTTTVSAVYSICVPFVARTATGSAQASAQAQEPPYTPLGQRTWTGSTAATFEFDVPVTDGLHVLRLTLPGQSDGAGGLINERAQVVAPRLTYPIGRAVKGAIVGRGQAGPHTYRVAGFGSPDHMVWDVSDPTQPTRLTGSVSEAAGGRWSTAFADDTGDAATYAVTSSSGLKRVSSIAALEPVSLEPAAQYLVVTHPDFLQAAQALAQHRRAASGLTTRVVTTQAIYDRYSGGLLDAEAIRSFVLQAYDSWRGPDSIHLLAYLVLMGDGSYDFKDRLNHGLANHLPPYLGEDFDRNWGGQAGSDHMFANQRGVPPSVLVGRIPARSAAEAMAVVEKVVRYQSEGQAEWTRGLFAADDPDTNDYGTGTPLNFRFDEMAEAALQTAATDPRLAYADLRRVYHAATQTSSPGFYYRESAAGTEAVVGAWQAGSLLTYYAGHSHFWGWAFPKLFGSEDIEALGPSPLTVLLSMTCFTGVFYHPNAPSLDEALLLAPDRGTITSLSPLSMGSAAGHRLMQGDVIRTLLGGGSIGEAMLAGKLALGSSYSDLVDTYGVLGDPALGLTPASTSVPVWTMLPMVANGAG